MAMISVLNNFLKRSDGADLFDKWPARRTPTTPGLPRSYMQSCATSRRRRLRGVLPSCTTAIRRLRPTARRRSGVAYEPHSSQPPSHDGAGDRTLHIGRAALTLLLLATLPSLPYARGDRPFTVCLAFSSPAQHKNRRAPCDRATPPRRRPLRVREGPVLIARRRAWTAWLGALAGHRGTLSHRCVSASTTTDPVTFVPVAEC